MEAHLRAIPLAELAKVRDDFTPRVKGPVSPGVHKNFACASSIERPRGQWGEVGGCKRGMNNALACLVHSGELNDANCRAPYLLVLSGAGTIKRNRARCLPAAYPAGRRTRHLMLSA